ncbi:amidohydrolase [Halobacteriales archaeon QS_1_68_17]|nr:MAG: amidohydrolase [Halobacteriales archaeon QS_1_68_17]
MRAYDEPELLLRDGRVRVMDDDRTVAESVLFRGSRVAAVGPADEVADAATDPAVVDLDGRTVLPGFNDAHTHLFSIGIELMETDLSAAETRREALDMLASNAAETPDGEWVLGFSYDESTWPAGEREYLIRDELDAITTAHPVAATRVDGHTVSVNSRALETVPFSNDEDVIEEGGTPTGRVVEDAAWEVKAASYPDPDRAREALLAATDRCHELGITSVQTMAGLTAVRETGSVDMEALFAAWRRDELDLRVTYYARADQVESLVDLELPRGFGDDRLRIGGIKTFSDGAIGAQTANLHGEFADDPGNGGTMVNDADQLREWYRRAARAGAQVATHSIGGAGIDVVVDQYAAVIEECDLDDHRFRIEHLELATDEALDRIADLGVVASMQPNFLQWSTEGGLYESRLGTGNLPRNNRFADVLDAGIPLAFGSDKMPPGPLYGIRHAVTADHDTQRLSVDEAVTAYTRGAAYAEATEDRKGTLEPGMLGDAVILDGDPFAGPAHVADTEIAGTVFDGEVVYRAF